MEPSMAERTRKRQLTHADASGRVRMVDVSAKRPSLRSATARGFVRVSPEALALVADGRIAKGDPLQAARMAGIMAAKRTADLIPLCHPLPLASAQVDVELESEGIAIVATVKTSGPTGVEMEALTAVSVAALTVYDMLKAADRSMTIEHVHLIEKRGGRSGLWRRQGA
jgi:cyclic pyranopterin monophosphate synthase